ncbi:hypothetical protein STSP2_01214 [Anaerohalosphaera lusitana]|uniref:Ice-binding protein C-terminal domain-containing protein n=1 Tax=Anaerohalosphaera lusitana TaxID=1936003 RepID=A0A1U9NJF8_9BACT|nr:PEP-CTERM sorting domain-containing protein [Anaerohalosphaera lusitana]AQT68059.1 hypothetical protein STSP2_01214 [Anaerohalosphaera lusitana]
MIGKKMLLSAVLLVCAAGLTQAGVTYVDADLTNTTLADGTAVNVTTSGSAATANDQWHVRTGFGNGSDVFASHADSDSPVIVTAINGLVAGETYSVSSYFWVAGDGTPGGNQEWDMSAGLSESGIVGFRYGDATQITDSSYFDSSVMLSEGDRRLFEASLGTAVANSAGQIQVFVSDLPGNDDRTWYDGVGASVVPEPATLSILGLGGLLIARRRRSA